MKQFLLRYRHAFLMVGYMPIYLILFFLVEHQNTDNVTIIECAADRKIPFCEWFIFPYFLWFPFIAFGVIYFIFANKEEYYRLSASLITGMTVFLIVSFVFPNGLAIRPNLSELGRDNLAIRMLSALHSADTSTNVIPSIHVYNSLAMCFALLGAKGLKGKYPAKVLISILTLAICASTVFLKQHSLWDVLTALLLFLAVTPICYLIRKPIS